MDAYHMGNKMEETTTKGRREKKKTISLQEERKK